MKYLLDTCVVSELVKKKPQPSVVRWLQAQDSADLFISCMTIGELEKGITKRGGDARAKELKSWLLGILRTYGGRVIPVSMTIAREWGRICGENERLGHPRPMVDSVIAATASVEKMALVTRNVNDFVGFNVSVFNPFELTFEY